jgi:hypothetical protein
MEDIVNMLRPMLTTRDALQEFAELLFGEQAGVVVQDNQIWLSTGCVLNKDSMLVGLPRAQESGEE